MHDNWINSYWENHDSPPGLTFSTVCCKPESFFSSEPLNWFTSLTFSTVCCKPELFFQPFVIHIKWIPKSLKNHQFYQPVYFFRLETWVSYFEKPPVLPVYFFRLEKTWVFLSSLKNTSFTSLFFNCKPEFFSSEPHSSSSLLSTGKSWFFSLLKSIKWIPNPWKTSFTSRKTTRNLSFLLWKPVLPVFFDWKPEFPSLKTSFTSLFRLENCVFLSEKLDFSAI
jgi:hypothetical protein